MFLNFSTYFGWVKINNILGIKISFEGFFGDFAFFNPSKLICTPNI